MVCLDCFRLGETVLVVSDCYCAIIDKKSHVPLQTGRANSLFQIVIVQKDSLFHIVIVQKEGPVQFVSNCFCVITDRWSQCTLFQTVLVSAVIIMRKQLF